MVCARSSLDLVPEVVVSESVFGILVVKERKDEWRRKRFCESVYKRRKSESSIASMRDEVGHQCPVRPSQLVYPPAVLGRKGTRNPSPLSALSRMRKRCARCDGDAVALERAPWTLVQEWGERVTCLVVTRSKLNGLVGLLGTMALYGHYGRSANVNVSAGVKRSLKYIRTVDQIFRNS